MCLGYHSYYCLFSQVLPPVEPPKAEEAEKKKVKKTKKDKGRTDEELFGNTDDIFASVPENMPKKKVTKKKKKTAATGEGAKAGEAAAGEVKVH